MRSHRFPSISLAFTCAACLLLAGCEPEGGPGPLDLLILGGTVIDGTGAPSVEADVAVRGNRVVFVGDVAGREARDTLHAADLVVAPGFIDVHNHSDMAIAEYENRLNEGFIRQGVTLIVGSPDGAWSPNEVRQLMDAYEANGVGTSYAFYVGHNGVRREVMGSDYRRPATPEEVDAMRELVRQGMDMGFLGLSTGLMYEPGMFSTTEEVVALAREVAPYGGIYDSHDRDPVHDFLASTAEVIEIGERAGVPARVAHFKTVGLANEGLNPEAIRLIEEARARGLDVVSDQYPYDGAATATLDQIVVVPPEWREDPDFDLRPALRDPEAREALRRTSEEGIDGGFAWIRAVGYGSMRVTSSPGEPGLVGRYLPRLARERGLAEFDLVSELIVGSEEPVGITLGAIREEDVRELMAQPWNMIASDGAWSDGNTPVGHPRSTGTFPRVLGHYVRDEGVLSLEEAIHKMTGLPAGWHGWEDRGTLVPGAVADVVVFDPRTVRDRSTWTEPHLYAEGIVHVLVNGVFVLRDAEMTGEAPGTFVSLAR
jgi:N-acyl-D-amino-acid deacylase